MEDIQLPSVFGISLSSIVAIITIVVLLFKFGTHLIRALEWHDRYFVRKRLSELEAVRKCTDKTPQLTHYIDDALAIEGFRIASGITTSPQKMQYLIQLSKDGVWTNAQLRSASRYLSLAPGLKEPILDTRFIDKVGAGLGLLAAVASLVLGSIYFLQIAFAGKPLLWLAGFAVLSVFVLASRLFITDFIDYKVVKRIRLHERLKNGVL
jgi:hypothetical protein